MNHRDTDKEKIKARAYSCSLPVVKCEGTAQSHSQGMVSHPSEIYLVFIAEILQVGFEAKFHPKHIFIDEIKCF